MSESENKVPAEGAETAQAADEKLERAPKLSAASKGDIIALGIGCAVFLIMLVAVVLVGIAGR
jgi:hypothetical protein